MPSGDDTTAKSLEPEPIADTALDAFVLMLGYLQRPADPAQLRHAAGKGGERLEASDLLRLAKQLDVKARLTNAPIARLARQPLPAIAESSGGAVRAVQGVSIRAVAR